MSLTILTEKNTYYLLFNIIEGEKDECWPFLNIKCSYFHPAGYGAIRYVDKGIRTAYLAHRLAYLYYNGLKVLDESIKVCHTCDTPPCCNPNHLFLGTDLSNAQDKVNKGRHMHGTSHYSTDLDDDDIREIRRRAAQGELWTNLSKEFGTSVSNMGNIINRRSWKHVK